VQTAEFPFNFVSPIIVSAITGAFVPLLLIFIAIELLVLSTDVAHRQTVDELKRRAVICFSNHK
jgi:hypothetical protein